MTETPVSASNLWSRWWLQRHRHLLLALVVAAVLAALVLQWLLWQWNIRFLFGAWLLSALGLGLWRVWLQRRMARNQFIVQHRDTESLWLLAHAQKQGIVSAEARMYLIQRARQEAVQTQPRAVPYGLVLVLSLVVALLLQVRMVPAFLGWTLLGPWGPHVTVPGQVLAGISAAYQPAAYVQEPAFPLVAGASRIRLEQGGTLRLRGQLVPRLGQPVARLETSQGHRVAHVWGTEADDFTEFVLEVTTQGALHVRLSVESLGLTIDQPDAMLLEVMPDAKPHVEWSALPTKTIYDEDELWQATLTASDNHGVRWVGFHIADEHGTSVTDISDARPQRLLSFGERTTTAEARLTPGMYLDKLKSGVWTVTPIAQDWNAAVSEPGYGQAVTLVVQSRFDKHENLMDSIHELFLLAMGYTADRWELQIVAREAHKRVNEHWLRLQGQSQDAWSAFGLDVVERAVQKLHKAIDSPKQPALLFEAATLELMRAEELEQQSVVSDRMGDVERSQQDLMAALNDAAKSDEEIMQLVRELLQKMQQLSEASHDRNRPLPQELYNKEAFQQENLKEQKSDLQTMLEKLQSGDRAGAVDMLKSLMGDMDKMREELQKAGAASTPSDSQGPPQDSGESGQSAGQSSANNATAEQLSQVRKAKAEVQKALDEQVKALGKADAAKRELGERPGMNSGQAEGTMGQPRSQAGKAASQLQSAQKALEPDPAKPGSIFDREAQQVREASQGWQQARQRLDRPAMGEPRSGDPSQRLGEFQLQGEQSIQKMREAMQSLSQKEQALQQMQTAGGRSQSEGQRDADFDEEAQKAESNARLRAKLFDNFGAGMPDAEKNANQQYFDKLVR